MMPRPSASILIFCGLFITAVGLSVWVGLLIAEQPSSPISKFLLEFGGFNALSNNTEINEYLVFMAEDNPENREGLLTASPSIKFVAKSIIPDVLVVRILEEIPATLTRIRGLEFVRMVFRYEASFGCH